MKELEQAYAESKAKLEQAYAELGLTAQEASDRAEAQVNMAIAMGYAPGDPW